MTSVFVGCALAVLTYFTTTILPVEVSLGFHAALLAGIGAVYVGFALADGRTSMLLLESSGSLIFLALATVGSSFNPYFLVAGYIGHGLWDLSHHRSRVPGDYAEWYIPFCTAYDWVVGGYLLFLF